MEEILKGYHFDKDLKGYYKVEFYDDDGRCLNHWLSEHQIAYFKNSDDAVEYIEKVRDWNVFRFTQTLIKLIK